MKIFRKVRQKLASENLPDRHAGKVMAYLRYAIGEIILVVLGILIALQVNNWNTKRTLESNNEKYLEKMILDLQANNKRFNFLLYGDSTTNASGYSMFEEAVKTCDSLLKLTYLGLDKSNLNYILNAQFLEGQSYLNINDNTYRELINTGKLYTLGDKDLIEAINTYYKRCERETEYNDGNNDVIQKNIEKIEDGFGKIFLDARLDSINFNIENYPFYFDKHSNEYKNFQIGLANILDSQQLNMMKIKILMKKTDSLIKIINTYLTHD